jgi:dTDP-4-dehydrorhamnose reductase
VASPKEIDWLILGGAGQLSLSMQAVLAKHEQSFFAPTHAEIDVSNTMQVQNIRDAFAPRVIFNGAAWTDVESAESHEEEAVAVNGRGAENLALLSSQVGATFIQISTDYVFSGNDHGDYREDDITTPVSAYGRSKALGERAVQSQPALDFYILRTAWLYGSTGRNFAKAILRTALANDDAVNVVADQWGQPTSADDLARQIYHMVTLKLPFGIYHGTNSGRATWHEFAKEIFRLADADVGRVLPIDSSAYPSKVTRPANSVLGHAKWADSGLSPMRDWRLALADAMPSLLHAVKMEE